MESDVEFIACDFPEANRLTVHILAAVAEHEASMISARTKAALQAAKARGTKLGGQRGSRTRMASMAAKGARASAQKRQESITKRRNDLLPVIQELHSKGVTSLRELAAGLNGAGLTSARGGRWTATQVMRILTPPSIRP
jgi:DNA invertase Pin-like site-specific DNA recombinase